MSSNLHTALPGDQQRRQDSLGLVESPLQLIGAIEAQQAGLLGSSLEVFARPDVEDLQRFVDELESAGVPDAVRITRAFPKLELWASRNVFLGDVYSGAIQLRSLLSGRPTRIVIGDDGTATLDLVGELARSTSSLQRTRVAGSAAAGRRSLGWLVHVRLRRLASQGGLTLFSSLELPPDLVETCQSSGASIVANRFEWLRALPVEDQLSERTIVVGSGLVADGFIDPAPYIEWVLSFADEGEVRYLPHRRSDPSILSAIKEAGITIDTSDLPAEFRLRGLTHGQRVVSLPSTVVLSLPVVLAGASCEIVAISVPDAWWTAAAPREFRDAINRAAPGA